MDKKIIELLFASLFLTSCSSYNQISSESTKNVLYDEMWQKYSQEDLDNSCYVTYNNFYKIEKLFYFGLNFENNFSYEKELIPIDICLGAYYKDQIKEKYANSTIVFIQHVFVNEDEYTLKQLVLPKEHDYKAYFFNFDYDYICFKNKYTVYFDPYVYYTMASETPTYYFNYEMVVYDSNSEVTYSKQTNNYYFEFCFNNSCVAINAI